jgi:aspartyl-tRNA(Asn)/glutamyl-tRNA(Gln) amidotransferase subunit A
MHSIAALHRLYRAKSASPVEVTQACLDRIDSHDKDLRAFVLVTPERALADARAAEADFMAGIDKGPMQGIPYGLKDIIETAGIRTTGQSRLLADHVPSRDAAVVARLAAGGGVLLGKNTTWEFAHGGPSWDVLAPPARNPWNLAHHPAGSSSGSAAAVAAGFTPAAVGSDTGGSIRGPAAACGTAGLKPTYGRVSRRGVLPNCYSQDHVGPLAWTAQDCALILSAIAGHDPEDPGSSPAPIQDFSAALDGTCRGLTIGVPWAWVDEARTSEPTRRAFEAALDVLRGLGAGIVPVTLPSLEAYSDVKKTIAMAELFAIHGRDLRARPQLFGASLRYRVQCGALIRAEDYLQATRMRAELAAAMQRVFATVDALVMPSGEPAGKLEPTPHSWLFTHPSLTAPFNVTGHPALAVCMGFADNGLPFSLQIAARLFDDATALRVGDAYEKATAWRTRRPALEGVAADPTT